MIVYQSMMIKIRIFRRRVKKVLSGPRKNVVLLTLVTWTSLAVTLCWRLSTETSLALLPPPPPDQDLQHFRRNRSLIHYIENVQLLIEPSHPPCSSMKDVHVVVLVTSSPGRFEHRDAIRSTWGRHLPTYFIMGLDGGMIDERLVDNYIEAKIHSDLIVYDFREHYQNLTLKTALMLQWTLERCASVDFLYKTDDDVIINPWILEEVVEERRDARLLGYTQNNTLVHRDEHNKWFLPRWLCAEDLVPQYLTGPGYLINGAYIKEVLRAAYTVPMINIEDIYFTYTVAKKELRYALTHDERLTPYRPWPPWLPVACAYWMQASIHSLTPAEIYSIWNRIAGIGQHYSSNKEVCSFYRRYLSQFVVLY